MHMFEPCNFFLFFNLKCVLFLNLTNIVDISYWKLRRCVLKDTNIPLTVHRYKKNQMHVCSEARDIIYLITD